jgi:uncharacterized protein
MSERTSYPPGTFSWADLATTDLAGAKAFYEQLFGWEFEDMPVGESGVYSMASKDGLHVAAASEFADQPPHWNNYVTVTNVDDAAAQATEAGGTVVAEPFDVLTAGRMAIVQDPTGALLAVWQPGDHPGARLVNEPGAMTWNDLTTPDVGAAARFYSDWLGWRVEEIPESGGYHVIWNGDRTNGGMLPQRPEMGPIPPHWTPYFGTDGLERGIERVKELGGQHHHGPLEVPQGAFALVADPQGAVFALWDGDYDD